MCFTGTIYVEITQPHDLRPVIGNPASDVLVKQQFGITVNVERTLEVEILPERLGRTVHGGRRCIDQLDALIQAVVEQLGRVAIVGVHHVAAVPFRRHRTGPLVKNTPGLKSQT